MLNLIQLKVLAAVARHGSVTEAAKELHYSQPSVSHYLSRLEAASGAKLVQRVGRGIRLTPEGRLLASRAAEILGRVEAATNELAAQVGLRSGRVRLAANASALSTIVPMAALALSQAHPGLELCLSDSHPVEAFQLLRQGEIDIALTFQYAHAPADKEEFRLVHIGDDPIYLISQQPDDSIANHRHSAWIGGCQRCQEELSTVCRQEGFTPRMGSVSDDMVVVQALVAAGNGVTTLPGLALQAHRHPDVHTTEVAGFSRRIFAVTYGAPPDPPAVAAVLAAVTEAAASATSVEDPAARTSLIGLKRAEPRRTR
jgi:DNA-binding transcriptional LysR family regulator